MARGDCELDDDEVILPKQLDVTVGEGGGSLVARVLKGPTYPYPFSSFLRLCLLTFIFL
jgi:hypothetical protein